MTADEITHRLDASEESTDGAAVAEGLSLEADAAELSRWAAGAA
jgi:hypothetical protein